MEKFETRFKALIDRVANNTNEFAQSLGYAKASVMYNILNGKSFPSFDTIEKIKTKYPRVDINWLITGKGNMFYDTISVNEEISQNRENENTISSAFYERLLADRDEKIKELKEDKEFLKGIVIRELRSLGKLWSNLISPSEESLSKN
jgi:hypothetical protein